MLSAALSLLIAPLLGPQDPSWDVLEVRGRVEMSSAEAVLSARDKVLDQARADLEERGARLMAQESPAWLPGFVARGVLDRWLAHLELEAAYEVVDRDDETFDHDFGQSYRTTLHVEPDAQFMDRAGRLAVKAIANARDRMVMLGLGTAGFWGLLAVGLGWLNRLSRGYMWKRLTLIGTLLGVAVPALVLVA